VMSASPPKAGIAGRQLDVRFVPQGDILRCGSSFATLAAILRASSRVSLVCHQV
jgi:hypothetical protein